MDRDQLEAIMAEAHALGLRTTTHIGVEETTAKDYIELGVSSIEHFYGIADAALDGVQRFPPDMNYNNEVQRFARAGELWTQADRGKLSRIVDMMVAKQVGWSPTLSIYEASRDVDARAEPALVQGLPAPRARGLLPSLARQPRLLLPRVDQHAGGALEAAVPRLDGRPARVRPQGRPRHDG